MSKELNEAAEAASYNWVADNPTEIMSHRQSFSAGFNAGANWQAQQDRWIPCSERMPDDFKERGDICSCTTEYLVFDATFGVSKAWLKKWNWDNGDTLIPRKKGDVAWESIHYNYTRVTHWRPLPQPPTV